MQCFACRRENRAGRRFCGGCGASLPVIYEGELHELRAQLAEREGRTAERAAALERAHACYVRFGMSAQAARVSAAAEGAA